MKSNLLSVQRFCRDNRTSFYFDANRFQIQDLTGKPLYKGSSKDGHHPITGLSLPSWNSRVSKIQSSSQHTILSQAALHSSYIASLPKSDLSSTDLWHMRLGHPQHRVLHHVLNRLFVSHKLPMSNTFCKYRVMGKMTQLPFSSSTNSTCITKTLVLGFSKFVLATTCRERERERERERDIRPVGKIL